ncbi:hypothetical protein BDV96DRAFT_592870 [Lophiotrema nucula]|uniref:Fungal-type protein kinase domain-containing protein n=1 Tax=Lophiotrema nucula TaxID=690887 RepID=A0A6A5YD50_9PLEO|nr:hypothetical protein BDV96DRAFT_592870 [Lophiotrema nucula]
MTDATRSAIIKANPIAHGLHAFRDSARSLVQGPAGSSSMGAPGRIDDERLRGHALDLLTALMTLPASRSLPSGTREMSLLVDLSRLIHPVTSGDFDVQRIRPLLTAVLTHESDSDVWEKVYELIAESTATTDANVSTPPPRDPPRTPSVQQTPPPRVPSRIPSFQQTPTNYSSGSLWNPSELRRHVDPILKAEVRDNLRIDHPDVFKTFFGKIPKLAEIAAAVLQSCKEEDPPLFQEDIGWVNWPTGCEEASVLQFLRTHFEKFLLLADNSGFRPPKSRRCITEPNRPISGAVSTRKLDIGLAYGSDNGLDESKGRSHDWSDILVPGELKSNPQEDNHNSTWLDLIRYAREIFSAQATRRFVLGFTLCGSIMRIWECDRLGVVGSTPYDINKEAPMFVSIIMGYFWMSEEELGFDPTIAEEGRPYISIQRGVQTERICLEKLIMRQRSVAGRATTCWKGFVRDAPDQALVIKDSWEYEERPEEGLLLKEATEVGVENVARHYYHEIVRIGNAVDDVVENVRKGLSDTVGRNPLQLPTAPFESITGPATSLTSGPARGRSRSRTQTTGQKRSLSRVHASMPPPKRPKRSSSDSPVKQGGRNRVHRRLIMRDAGKSFYEADSLRGIPTGLLGGIKGHESLLDAKILHRDISIGNVMLTMAEDDGFLIDLDLAIKIDREKASGAPSKTGTKVFMAIGALYGENHNFMHDLESFFWVLFLICTQWTGPGSSISKTKYESWNYKDTEELADLKMGIVVEEDRFTAEVEREFTAQCKPLIPCILELREELFPGGRRPRGEDRQLYSRMKSVLERAIETLDTTVQQ